MHAQSTAKTTGVITICMNKIESTPVELLVKSTWDNHIKNTPMAALEMHKLVMRTKRSELMKIAKSIAICGTPEQAIRIGSKTSHSTKPSLDGNPNAVDGNTHNNDANKHPSLFDPKSIMAKR